MNFLNIKSTNGFDSIEFHVTVNDVPVESFLGIGMHYNWIALPKEGISCELAHFSDSYWNYDSLSNVPKDERTVIGPVVTPPESKETGKKSPGTNIANTNTNIYKPITSFENET